MSELSGGAEGEIDPFSSNVGSASEERKSESTARPGVSPCPCGAATWGDK